MAFNYSGNPSDSDLDAVRFLSGDTDSTQALLQDEEIAFILTQTPNVTLAASDACNAISAAFSRKITRSNVGQSGQLAGKRDAYKKMADTLRKKAMTQSEVFIGGQSKSAKRALIEDVDAVQQDFRIGQDDRTRPIDDDDHFH